MKLFIKKVLYILAIFPVVQTTSIFGMEQEKKIVFHNISFNPGTKRPRINQSIFYSSERMQETPSEKRRRISNIQETSPSFFQNLPAELNCLIAEKFLDSVTQNFSPRSYFEGSPKKSFHDLVKNAAAFRVLRKDLFDQLYHNKETGIKAVISYCKARCAPQCSLLPSFASAVSAAPCPEALDDLRENLCDPKTRTHYKDYFEHRLNEAISNKVFTDKKLYEPLNTMLSTSISDGIKAFHNFFKTPIGNAIHTARLLLSHGVQAKKAYTELKKYSAKNPGHQCIPNYDNKICILSVPDMIQSLETKFTTLEQKTKSPQEVYSTLYNECLNIRTNMQRYNVNSLDQHSINTIINTVLTHAYNGHYKIAIDLLKTGLQKCPLNAFFCHTIPSCTSIDDITQEFERTFKNSIPIESTAIPCMGNCLLKIKESDPTLVFKAPEDSFQFDVTDSRLISDGILAKINSK